MGTEPRGLLARGRRSHRDAHPARVRGTDQVGHAPHDAWRPSASSIGILADFDYDHAQRFAVPDQQPLDRRHQRAATTSASTASRCRCSRCPPSSRCLCVIYSWNHFPEPHNPKAFLALVLILEVGMNGTFVAQDLILFFVFFEIVLLPMFFMIGVWGGPNRQYASIKFFLFTLFGSALMLLSFLALFFQVDVLPNVPVRSTASTWWLLSNAGGSRHHPRRPAADLRGPVPRLRDQGPDVPVPHVAAGRAHRGADGGLGPAGGHPAEARAPTVSSASRCRCLPEAAKSWAPWIGLLAVIGIIYGALGVSRRPT